jgi:hypothetical protein
MFAIYGTMVAIKHTEDGRILLPCAKFRVRHRDYFHLKNLYYMLHEWLVEEEWGPPEDQDFPETFYLQRDTQKSGSELWIWWRLEKPVAESSYFLYCVNLDYHVILLRDAEVMHEGQKFKTNWGEVEIVITAQLELDPEKEWRSHPLLKNIHEIWQKRIYKKSIDTHVLLLYREAYRIQELIKTYCKLKTYLPEPEGAQFYPQVGLGEPK